MPTTYTTGIVWDVKGVLAGLLGAMRRANELGAIQLGCV